MTRTSFRTAQAGTAALMLLIPLVLGMSQSIRPELPAPSAALVAVGVKASLT